jgi:hypothetical protein
MTKPDSLFLQLKRTIQVELELFPKVQAQDLAKLLYQAAYGPQHAVSDPEGLYEWLNQEMKVLSPHPSEPLLQPVWLHHPMFRLHLARATHNLMDIQQIHELFLQSCSEPTPLLPFSWNELVEMSCHLLNQLSQEYNSTLSHELKTLAFSQLGPFHHSEFYRKMYTPHYRLVSFRAIQTIASPDSILFIEAQRFLC